MSDELREQILWIISGTKNPFTGAVDAERATDKIMNLLESR